MKQISCLFMLLGICLIFLPQAWSTIDEEAGGELCIYYFNLGNSCLKRGDGDCAIANFNKAITINQRYVKAYYSRASA